MEKICILDSNKICDNCNKCNICDLDSNKICDNCGKCITYDKDYVEIKIDGIVDSEDELDEYIYDETDEIEFDDEYELNKDDVFSECLYIEDIPELKKEYDEKINKILKRKRVE